MWFIWIAGVCYIGGAVTCAWNKEWKMAAVWTCYAVANFFLGTIKE